MSVLERALGGPEIEVTATASRRQLTLEYQRAHRNDQRHLRGGSRRRGSPASSVSPGGGLERRGRGGEGEASRAPAGPQ